jgi:hypothetical protein
MVEQKPVGGIVALTSESRMRCHMSGMGASVWNVISTLAAELFMPSSP